MSTQKTRNTRLFGVYCVYGHLVCVHGASISPTCPLHANFVVPHVQVGLVEWLDDKVVAPSDPLVAALEHDVYVVRCISV